LDAAAAAAVPQPPPPLFAGRGRPSSGIV